MPMEPGTCHTDLTEEEYSGRDGGKRMIQRINEENGHQENTVLSTWRWCKQGRPRCLLLTVLNKYLFNFIKYEL